MRIDGKSFEARRILLLEEKGNSRLVFVNSPEELDFFEKDYDSLGVLPQFQLGLIHVYQKSTLRKNVENESEIIETKENEQGYSELKYQKDFSNLFTFAFMQIVGNLEITAWNGPEGIVYTWTQTNQKQRAA